MRVAFNRDIGSEGRDQRLRGSTGQPFYPDRRTQIESELVGLGRGGSHRPRPLDDPGRRERSIDPVTVPRGRDRDSLVDGDQAGGQDAFDLDQLEGNRSVVLYEVLWQAADCR